MPTFEKTNLALYADDTAIYAHSFNAQVASSQTQIHVNKIEKYFNKWKMKINEHKTEQIVFTRKFTNNKILNKLRINGNKVDTSKSVKYLGITLDSRLNFKKHINNVIIKANIALKTIYALMSKNSKMNKRNKITLYKTMIRPVMTYACPAWSHISKTAYKPLETFQNKCLRIILNKSRYTRVSELRGISGVESVKKYTRILSTKFFDKQIKHNNLMRNITKINENSNTFKKIKHKLIHQHLPIFKENSQVIS
ncbi:RVT 1 domain containing protein [Asbolus verrucosus]|uniref:RVT 1 domain containing protein n=1 Tax=Asbolus verrucosus TaxID=1661398 RepID=A0A482VMZ9_ASBVE|nr:RVT 1 domain containing protein [Asbolus verrucosus]